MPFNYLFLLDTWSFRSIYKGSVNTKNWLVFLSKLKLTGSLEEFLQLVADPGFPRPGAGEAPTSDGDAPTYYLTKCSPKPHENEIIWTVRGSCTLLAPPDSANSSAHAKSCKITIAECERQLWRLVLAKGNVSAK